MQRLVLLVIGSLVALGAIAFLMIGNAPPTVTTSADEVELAAQAIVDVVLPDRLSAREQQGAELFRANCQACHGVNAAGSENGPPLVHRIYEPGHHGDQSFLLAAERGVRAHHWEFGDMPPVEDISRAEVSVITSYVRGLQRANGIN